MSPCLLQVPNKLLRTFQTRVSYAHWRRWGNPRIRGEHIDYGFFGAVHSQHRFHDLFLLQAGLWREAAREASPTTVPILRPWPPNDLKNQPFLPAPGLQ